MHYTDFHCLLCKELAQLQFRPRRCNHLQCRPNQQLSAALRKLRVHIRDVLEWLLTFPFPPIAIYLISIPSRPIPNFLTHPHSHVIHKYGIRILKCWAKRKNLHFENRSASCIRLVIMLLSRICFFFEFSYMLRMGWQLTRMRVYTRIAPAVVWRVLSEERSHKLISALKYAHADSSPC